MRANQFQYPSQFTKDEMAPQEPSLEAQTHPMIWGGKFAIVSNGKPSFVAESPAGSLQQELNQKGVQHEPTEGHYGGVERSFILHNPSREQAMELARRHGQEAVIFSDGGQHELIYVNGPNAGKYHPAAAGSMHFYRTRPRDNYTKIPGHGFARFHFDFNKLLEVPKKSLVPQSDEGVAKTMPTVNDLKKGLAEAIKRQIEKYQNDLVELRDRELTKGEGELVSGIGNDAGDFSFGTCPMCQRGDDCECVELSKAEGIPCKGGCGASLKAGPVPGIPVKLEAGWTHSPERGHRCPKCSGSKDKGARPGFKRVKQDKPEPREAAADEGLHNVMDYEKSDLCEGCGSVAKMCKCGEMSKGESCLLCGEPPTMCECVSKLSKSQTQQKKDRLKAAIQARKLDAKYPGEGIKEKAAAGGFAHLPPPHKGKTSGRAERAGQATAKGEFMIDGSKASETPAKGQSKAGEPRIKHTGDGPGTLPGDKAPKQQKGDDGSGGEESASMEVSASDKGLGKNGDVAQARPPTKGMGAKPPTQPKMQMGEKTMEKRDPGMGGRPAPRPAPPPASFGLKPAQPNFATKTPTPAPPTVHPEAGNKKVIPGAAGKTPGTWQARMQTGDKGLKTTTPAPAPKKGLFGRFGLSEKEFGKSEGFGNCALCGNPEHTGDCQ